MLQYQMAYTRDFEVVTQMVWYSFARQKRLCKRPLYSASVIKVDYEPSGICQSAKSSSGVYRRELVEGSEGIFPQEILKH